MRISENTWLLKAFLCNEVEINAKFKVSMVPFWIAMYGPQGQNQALVMVVLKCTCRKLPCTPIFMVLSSITKIRPLKIPTDRKSKFSIYIILDCKKTAWWALPGNGLDCW